MNEVAQGFLRKAKDAQSGSKFLLEGGHVNSAASEAYYVLFFTAQALLRAKGVDYRHSHSAVIRMYGFEFAKSKEIDPKFHRYLINARKREIKANYRLDEDVTKDEVREMMVWGKEFLQAAKKYLENQ
ncbi:MAG: HEPN domain-containing protein [Chloroflexota bacterium]